MKSTLLGTLLLIFLGSLSVHAQQSGNDIPLAASNQVHADVGKINLQFCNQNNLYRNKNNLTLEVEPGEAQDICMEFRNETKESITMKVNIIDGGMTNDSIDPKRSCQNESSKEYFGKYAKEHEQLVTIPAKSSKKVTSSIQLPKEQLGYNYGCVTYSIPKKKTEVKKEGIGYDVIIRKAGLIDIKVKGELSSILELPGFTTASIDQTEVLRGPLIIDVKKDHLDAYTSIKNPGSVAQKIQANAVIRDIFGRSFEMSSAEMLIAPNEEKTIHFYVAKEKWWYFNYFGNKKAISWYRGPYLGYAKISYAPYLPQGNQDTQLVGGTFIIGGNIFLMPRWLVILLALVVSILTYQTIKKQKRKQQDEQVLQKQTVGREEENNQTTVEENQEEREIGKKEYPNNKKIAKE